MLRNCLVIALFVLFGLVDGVAASPALSRPLNLILPTSNDALLRGDGAAFYMHTVRNFRGRRSYPWEAGQYGFVRNPKETSEGIVFTRFHEGLDIRPQYRDAAGEPLDTVRAIDVGYVAYVNNVASYSNYGKYVVVEHWWSGAPFYSLYAHLGSVDVRVGQRVEQGARLGRIGYTGRGIDKGRAHLHFEINMLLNREFPRWYETAGLGSNRHDMYNGYNLAGLDAAALYVALQNNPNLTIEQFLSRQEPFYKVVVPNDGPLDLLYRYPFLAPGRRGRALDAASRAASWEISFTQTGLPIRIEPHDRQVSGPTVTMVKRADIPYSYLTGGTLTGSGAFYELSSSGRRYLDLLTIPVDPDAYPQHASLGAEPTPPVQRIKMVAPEPVEATSVDAAARRLGVELQPGTSTPEVKTRKRRKLFGW